MPLVRAQSRAPADCNIGRDHGTLSGDGCSSRRAMLLGIGTVMGASILSIDPTKTVAFAAEELETFYGYATPPTSYGGYGGNANEPPKYTFQYPSDWKPKTVNKVEKGTQGIDSKIVNPRAKGNEVFVITLGRAGEDDKSFRLTDVDTTFQGFVGADYELQDAIQNSSGITKTEREVGGQKFFDYDIDSPDVRYISTVTVKNGKIFAFFIKAPTRVFKSKEAMFKGMLSSFRTM